MHCLGHKDTFFQNHRIDGIGRSPGPTSCSSKVFATFFAVKTSLLYTFHGITV